MNRILKGLLIVSAACLWAGCHEVTVGFLETENARYVVDSMTVRRVLDPLKDLDKKLMETGAYWQSTAIQGVLGTAPLTYEFAGVTASEGGDSQLFEQQIVIRGGGRICLPSKDLQVPVGRYRISLRVSNPGYSAELKDVFTIIVE